MRLKKLLLPACVVSLLAVLTGCMGDSNPLDIVGLGQDARTSARSSGSLSENSWKSIDNKYYGRVFLDSPYWLADDPDSVDANTNLYPLLSDPILITDNARLQESCVGNGLGTGDIESCYEVSATDNDLALSSYYDRWAFSLDSSEFAQVNTFYHTREMLEFYHDTLRELYTYQAQPALGPSITYYTSIPESLYTNNANWFGGINLKIYADCDDEEAVDNAYFNFIPDDTLIVCMGRISIYDHLRVALDSEVINHELGHALTLVQMNMRNIANDPDSSFRSDIGYYGYDEAGAINEGVADIYTHNMNEQDSVFRYIFGSVLPGGFRPLSEDHESHASGLSTDPEDRLSYPHFINYVQYAPEVYAEELHQGGMIAGHFLRALRADIKETCSYSKEEASKVILKALIESYALLGDLTSTGNDHQGTGNINLSGQLDPDGVPTALLWHRLVRPINYRSFFQTFSRFLVETIVKEGSILCDGTNYPRDQLEKMLDSYGLLLFDNYNEDGNHFENGHSGNNTTITKENRLKSVLISKDLIDVDKREGKSEVFIFDTRRNMLSAVENLQANGTITELSDQTDSELSYNNGNGQISPGEVVGIAFNLYNNSNSTMAGIQVLANDWDHVKTDGGERKPCPNLGDDWPSESEGAADVDGEDETVSGTCGFVTRLNGNSAATTGGDEPDEETNENIHPVCFVQLTEDDATFWGSQELLREDLELEKKDCLSGEDNTHDCFIRAIKGAEGSWYSRIDPHKTWGDLIVKEDGSPNYSTNNLLYFEVNKETPPGTTFNCRVRVRFANCSDCWFDPDENDGDDFLDYEFSGSKPFKIIHYQFTVID